MSQSRECILTTQCPYVGVTQVLGGRCDGLRGVLVHTPGFPVPLLLSVPAADLFVRALVLAVQEARNGAPQGEGAPPLDGTPPASPSFDLPESWMEDPDDPMSGDGDAHGN